MEIKNIDRALAIIPDLQDLQKARTILSDADCHIEVYGKGGDVELPPSVRLNILNVVNCEYERTRKEIKEL